MTATQTSSKLKLPTVLADLDLKLGKALNAPLREIFPSDEKFQKAEQPEEIAKVLIRTELHERLVSAKIAYRLRIPLAGRQRVIDAGESLLRAVTSSRHSKRP